MMRLIILVIFFILHQYSLLASGLNPTHSLIPILNLVEDECPIGGPLMPFLITCKNGTILKNTKTLAFPKVPPSYDPGTGVKSKNIVISDSPEYEISARVYFPKNHRGNKKLPVLVYFHGGAFCIGSTADAPDNAYLNRVSSEAPAIIISAEYPLFPEHPIPAAYDASWSVLQWVASLKKQPQKRLAKKEIIPNYHSQETPKSRRITRSLSRIADFDRVFIGGDSAGANIAHNLAIRAGSESLPNEFEIAGAFLAMPYFIGSKPVPNEPSNFFDLNIYKLWKYVCPESVCPDGVDDPRINPMGPTAPSLANLKIGGKLRVYVAELDELRARGWWYVDMVKSSGWEGEVKLYEAKKQGHVFHVFNSTCTETDHFIRRLSSFLYSS